MKRVKVKVPTKVTLFGEHAVVYGFPAIASTIPVSINISGRLIDRPVIAIEIKQGFPITATTVIIDRDYVSVDLDQRRAKNLLGYILTAIDVCEQAMDIPKLSKGYSITVESSLPMGVGLGTSAAISAGVVSMCLLLNNGIAISNLEDQRYDIAKLAWNIERIVQGSASPMDTFTVTLGGLRFIEPLIPRATSIDIDYGIPIIIGYTDRRSSTAELIQKVRHLKDRSREIFDDILNTIGRIVNEAKKALIAQDFETLGLLMNINHSMLQALGAVSPEHDMLAHTLRRAGALGVKTSGAGGGGAFIVLAPNHETQTMLVRLVEAMGAKVVSDTLYHGGLEISVQDTN